MAQIDARLDRLAARDETIDARIERLTARDESIDARIDKLVSAIGALISKH